MDRKQGKYRLKPMSIMFTEYYFYLIAFRYDDENNIPYYFRIDRIVDVVRHREHFVLSKLQAF